MMYSQRVCIVFHKFSFLPSPKIGPFRIALFDFNTSNDVNE